MIGDRVQAKWEDGKMYFGKVLQVYEGIVSKCSDICIQCQDRVYVCLYLCTQTRLMFCSTMVWSTLLPSDQSGEGSASTSLISQLIIVDKELLFFSYRDQTSQPNTIMIAQLRAQKQPKRVEAVQESG